MQHTANTSSPCVTKKEGSEKRRNHQLRQYIKELEFNNNILQAQQEVSLDGILVMDEHWKMASFNTRFIDMWQISEHILSNRDDKESIQTVLDKLKNPKQFLACVEELMQNPDEHSRDTLELLDGRVFDRYSAPIYDKKDTLRGRVWFFRDITEITLAREKLKQQNKSLETIVVERTSSLEESNAVLKMREKELHAKNTGLRTLLHTVEEEKKYLKKATATNFHIALLPLFDMLKETRFTKKQQLILDSLEHVLEDMSAGMNSTLQQCRNPLTPMEMRVANFIAAGKISKEIATILSSSERTVEGHRSVIRRKLGLQQGENLRARLQAFS